MRKEKRNESAHEMIILLRFNAIRKIEDRITDFRHETIVKIARNATRSETAMHINSAIRTKTFFLFSPIS